MAKVTIEIQDIPGGKVEIKATPNFETMMKMDISGAGLSAAHGYGLAFINLARQISRDNSPSMLVKIPKILRPH